MTTISHQESKDLPSQPIDDWLSLLVLLQKLQTRLAEDRQAWAETGGDMAFLVEALRTEIQKMEKLGSHIDQEIRLSCQQAVQTQASEISRRLTTVVSTAFESTIQRLGQAAEKAIHQLQSFQDDRRQFKGWGLAIALILCIFSSVSGGIVVHWLHPQDRLSAEQWQLIQNGTILRKAWPNLSKKEQDKIMDLFSRG